MASKHLTSEVNITLHNYTKIVKTQIIRSNTKYKIHNAR